MEYGKEDDVNNDTHRKVKPEYPIEEPHVVKLEERDGCEPVVILVALAGLSSIIGAIHYAIV